MPDEILQVVYASIARFHPTEADLDAIREAANLRNPILGVTGVLLYGSGMFVQLLEGPDEAVHELLARIEADERHRNLRILVSQLSERRAAKSWAMGVLDLDTIEDEGSALEGLVRDLIAIFDDIEWDNDAGPAIEDLVLAFTRYGGPEANERFAAA